MMSHAKARKGPPVFLAFLWLAALLVQSCYMPHYDEGAMLSARMAKNLEKVSTLSSGSYHKEGLDYCSFVPEAAAVPTAGYWIGGSSGYSYHRLRYFSSAGLASSVSGSPNSLGEASVHFALNPTQMATLDSSSGRGGLFSVSAWYLSGATLRGVDIWSRDASNALSIAASASTIETGLSLIGGGQYRASDKDIVGLLFKDASGSTLKWASLSLPASSSLTASYLMLPSSLPSISSTPADIGAGAFFGGIPDTTLVMIYYLSGTRTGGGLCTYRFNTDPSTATPIVLAGVTHKLTALLSSSLLLAHDGLYTYLYDLNGVAVATLATGDFSFAGEYWDEGTAYSYFSRMRFVATSGDEGSLKVDLYRIATSKLPSLAN